MWCSSCSETLSNVSLPTVLRNGDVISISHMRKLRLREVEFLPDWEALDLLEHVFLARI